MSVDSQQLESFLEEVDEVCRLVQCLKEGTVPVSYVDDKLSSKDKSKEIVHKKIEKDSEEEKERTEALRVKVKELLDARARKEKLREKYAAYVEGNARIGHGTDYLRWDLWCPEDDDDDFLNSITPNNPQLKAMEKDIDERHKRLVSCRQVAERHRVKGNEAFKQKQYSEALALYEAGLDYEKQNVTLHANAAMATLKLQCYVQALEHCNSVLTLREVLNLPVDNTLTVKVLQRRAAAYTGLGQHDKAVEDLLTAAGLATGDKDLVVQLKAAEQRSAEAQRARAIKKVLQASDSSDCRGTESTDLHKMRQVEKLLQVLAGKPATRPVLPARSKRAGGPLQSHPLVEMAKLLGNDEAACLYFQTCNGIRIICDGITSASSAPTQNELDRSAAYDLLTAACLLNSSIEELTKYGFLPCVLGDITLCDETQPDLVGAACQLLQTVATHEPSRKCLSEGLERVWHCQQGKTKSNMERVLEVLQGQKVEVQLTGLMFLANCAVDRPVHNCLCQMVSAKSQALQCLAGRLRPQQPQERPISIQVAKLFTNAAMSEALRDILVKDSTLWALLVDGTMHLLGETPRPGDACDAALGLLANLCTSPPALQCWSGSTHLVTSILVSADHCRTHSMCLTILSRLAKEPEAMQILLTQDNMAAIMHVMETALNQEKVAQDDIGINRMVLKHAATLLATLSAACPEATGHLLHLTGGVTLLLSALSSNDNVVVGGNIALCISHVATVETCLAPLREGQAIALLLKLAKDSQGTAACRNAGIALAKLARDPRMLQQLRDLRGIEMIYQYVRP